MKMNILFCVRISHLYIYLKKNNYRFWLLGNLKLYIYIKGKMCVCELSFCDNKNMFYPKEGAEIKISCDKSFFCDIILLYFSFFFEYLNFMCINYFMLYIISIEKKEYIHLYKNAVFWISRISNLEGPAVRSLSLDDKSMGSPLTNNGVFHKINPCCNPQRILIILQLLLGIT